MVSMTEEGDGVDNEGRRWSTWYERVITKPVTKVGTAVKTSRDQCAKTCQDGHVINAPRPTELRSLVRDHTPILTNRSYSRIRLSEASPEQEMTVV